MKERLGSVQELLKEKNIRLSYQRLLVLEYMFEHCCHPTAEQIYHGLKSKIPTLSKTTIYNTMNAFVEAGLVRPVKIEDNEVRYDIITSDHGHFKCYNCGVIFDFEIDLTALASEILTDFKILDKDLFFRGICSNCQTILEEEA